MDTPTHTLDSIKAEAKRLGFYACGAAPASTLDAENQGFYRKYIAEQRHAGMAYMERNTDKRLNPTLLMPEARTLISVALNYYPAQTLPPDHYAFAYYAYGRDYHDLMKERLAQLLAAITHADGTPVQGRVFCDTAPLAERYWAWRCGLGWIGKNTQLIIPRAGSYFFLGELLIDATLDAYDHPQPNRCGNCSRCLEACPTQALSAPGKLDARHCLSYLTIEHREPFPDTFTLPHTIYGCDRCQQVCPWNRFATPTCEPHLTPSPQFLAMTPDDWHHLTVEQYRTLFKGSAVKRTKFEGLIRNIAAAKCHPDWE